MMIEQNKAIFSPKLKWVAGGITICSLTIVSLLAVDRNLVPLKDIPDALSNLSPQAQVGIYVSLGILGAIAVLVIAKWYWHRKQLRREPSAAEVIQSLKDELLPKELWKLISEYLSSHSMISDFLPKIDAVFPDSNNICGYGFIATTTCSGVSSGIEAGVKLKFLKDVFHAFAENRLNQFLSEQKNNKNDRQKRQVKELFPEPSNMSELEQLNYLKDLCFSPQNFGHLTNTIGLCSLKDFTLKACKKSGEFVQEATVFFDELEALLNECIETPQTKQLLGSMSESNRICSSPSSGR
jgi:hypothetical protein